ncbi:MAG: VanZ family protein [Bacteroidia bacterium]
MVASWIAVMITIHYLADNRLINEYIPWRKYINLSDVWGHFFLVGVLGFFVAMVTQKEFTFGPIKILKAVAFLMVLVSIEELTQLLRPNRGFSFADMGANILGLYVFSKIGEKLKNGFNKKKKH